MAAASDDHRLIDPELDRFIYGKKGLHNVHPGDRSDYRARIAADEHLYYPGSMFDRQVHGNPYFTILRPVPRTLVFNSFARSGVRRTLTVYPERVDAKSGNIVVTERDNHRIQIFDSAGRESRFVPFGRRGHGAGEFLRPAGVTTTNEQAAAIVVADAGNRRVCGYRIFSDGLGYGQVAQTFEFGHRMFADPVGVEYDGRRGLLYVVDAGTRRVSQHDLVAGGVCVGEMRPPGDDQMASPADVALDEHGRVYVTDSVRHRVYAFDRNGDFLCRFGGPGCGAGEFNKPVGLCFDREQNLFVADEGNNRIVAYRAPPSGDPRATASHRLGVVTDDVYVPKGVSVNVHQNLVVTTEAAHNFLQILKYK